VERLNDEQKQAGDLKALETLEHEGRTFIRRVERGGEHYYYLDGPLLAFSGTEDLIRRVMDRHAVVARAGPVASHLHKAGADQALAAWWVNPRAFDADLRRQAAGAKGPEAHGPKTFLRYW